MSLGVCSGNLPCKAEVPAALSLCRCEVRADPDALAPHFVGGMHLLH